MDAIVDIKTQAIVCYTSDPNYDLGDTLERVSIPEDFSPDGKVFKIEQGEPVEMTAEELKEAGLDPEHNKIVRDQTVETLKEACIAIAKSSEGKEVKKLAEALLALF